MAVTRLERKGKRNKSRAKNRVSKIKLLNSVPVIKNVDLDELKKSFEKPSKPAKKEAPVKEEASVEVVEEVKVEKAPKAKKETTEKKAATKKKPAAKKEDKKEEKEG